MSDHAGSGRSIRLPSCKQCRLRKVKCDTQRPTCRACSRNGVSCEFVDSSSGQVFTGQYIQELEDEQKKLEGLSQQPRSQDCDLGDILHSTRASVVVHPREEVVTPGNLQTAGISFLRLLFTNSEWREQNADLLRKFAERPQGSELPSTPSTLPEKQEAWNLVEKYLRGSHVQNPFLLRREVETTFEKVYSDAISQPEHNKHDLFTVFMIIAVGSVMPYRTNNHDNHPFSYYLAALEYFDSNFLGQGLTGIQDLLLIARFGIYYHIGTSIWDIAQLCMRMCIEQGLHRTPITPINSTLEQLQRRVFWHCYAIDRYSSTTLGRPFAIADHEITVRFPIPVNDEQLFNWTASLDTIVPSSTPNDMSVFLLYVRLRQITSRMHGLSTRTSKADNPDTTAHTLSGNIHVELVKFLKELKTWRDSAPVFPQITCLYHHADWHEFMYERYRLLLLRAAVDAVPTESGIPSRELVDMIADSSIELILLYAGLFSRGVITYTRSYFQMLFTGGLSLMFSIAALDQLRDFKIQTRAREALKTCEELLMQFSVQMKDSFYYTAVFEALHRETIRRSTLLYQRFLSSTAPTRRGSPANITPDGELALGGTIGRTAPVSRYWTHQTATDTNVQDFQDQSGTSHGFPGVYDDVTFGNSYPSDGLQFPGLDTEGNFMAEMLPNIGVSYWDGFASDWLSMEAGVGEYAYGDPYSDFNMWEGLQLDLNSAQ